jgi:hypothetical protein
MVSCSIVNEKNGKGHTRKDITFNFKRVFSNMLSAWSATVTCTRYQARKCVRGARQSQASERTDGTSGQPVASDNPATLQSFLNTQKSARDLTKKVHGNQHWHYPYRSQPQEIIQRSRGTVCVRYLRRRISEHLLM